MATTDIYDDMARLQLKMMQQRLANERDRQDRNSRPSSTTSQDSDTSVKLHRAVLRRQELLDKIKQEQRLNDDLKRPQSYNGHRHSPMPPPSRRSLPELRDRDRRHFVENQYRPMAQPYHLPPIQSVPQPPAPVYIQSMPQEQPKSTWNKGDFMEMMMMQNAQMHQMVMQQMMLSSMPAPFKPPSMQQPVVMQDTQSEGRRPTSVHHHHYGPGGGGSNPVPYAQPPPVIHHYTPLPPLNVRPAPYPYGRSSWYPSEVEPLKQPRVRAKPTYKKPVAPKKPRYKYPFPGNKSMQKLRHLFYAVWFTKILEKLIRKKKVDKKYEDESFIFGIQLKEAVAALHKIYLSADGSIYPLLRDLIREGAVDLTVIIETKSRFGLPTEVKQALQELVYLTENLIYQITNVMPGTGVLGTHRKAVVYEMIKEGKKFPGGYFWQIEIEQLDFDERGKTVNVGDFEAYFLLVGLFLSRSLVTTLLLKPHEYGLAQKSLHPIAERNLQLMATIIIYLVRKASVPPKSPPMPVAFEMQKFLYTDEEMAPVYKNMKKTLDYSEGLMRDWGFEYVKRLRGAKS